MIAIVDYGVGNLFSLVSSFSAIGEDAVATSDKEIIRKADKIVLPGVGAFEDASKKLFERCGNMQKKNKFNDLFVKNSMDMPFFLIMLGLMTIGLVMLTGIGDLSSGSAHLKGILFGLGAALLYALVIICNKKRNGFK